MIEVDTLPSHRDLEHASLLAQRAGPGHQHTPSHHRADADQPHLDLYNRRRVRAGPSWGCCRKGFFGASRRLHPVRLPRCSSPVVGTPWILMHSQMGRCSAQRPTELGQAGIVRAWQLRLAHSSGAVVIISARRSKAARPCPAVFLPLMKKPDRGQAVSISGRNRLVQERQLYCMHAHARVGTP